MIQYARQTKIYFELKECKVLEDFEKVALKYGYKKGWGYTQWKIRRLDYKK